MNGPGSQFETQLPTMQVASQHVNDVNQQIQTELTNLLNRLEPLTSSWQGAAATSFHTLKQRWHDNATKLNQALQGIGEGLGQSHQTYQSHETANVQDLNRAATNLD
ncbi:MAG: WXG100 family type VII secretion target [Mycobacterium sp.]